MTKRKKVKKYRGWVRKTDWEFLRFKDEQFEGRYIGNRHDFPDDMKVQIIIKEL